MKKTQNFRFFHAVFKKLWDKQTKITFLLFCNYLQTEIRKNSEKITQTYSYMADVVTFFGKIFSPKLITKNFFFFFNWFFEKTPFWESLKKFIVIATSITQIQGM